MKKKTITSTSFSRLSSSTTLADTLPPFFPPSSSLQRAVKGSKYSQLFVAHEEKNESAYIEMMV